MSNDQLIEIRIIPAELSQTPNPRLNINEKTHAARPLNPQALGAASKVRFMGGGGGGGFFAREGGGGGGAFFNPRVFIFDALGFRDATLP